jgi:dipeptidyl aminopeptidase/acylaminoacyl peptidase
VVDALTGQKSQYIGNGTISYSPDGLTMMITTPGGMQFANVEEKFVYDAAVDYFAVGAGEFYQHPALAWSHDSQYVLIAQPVNPDFPLNTSEPVVIWKIPVDGSPAIRLMELEGFFATFSFSPDLKKVAYWRTIKPQSNVRELHIVALDGSEHIVYDTADTLEFLGWSPFSQHFIYGVWSEKKAFIGDVCGDPTLLNFDGYPANVRWIDESRFLFERWSEDFDRMEVYLGDIFGGGTLKLNLEAGSWYNFRLIGLE